MSDELTSADAGGWLAKADDDLRVARIILAGDIGVEWAACFHAQQSAEKALKAILVDLGIDFPKTHMLDVWCRSCPRTRQRASTSTISSLSLRGR